MVTPPIHLQRFAAALSVGVLVYPICVFPQYLLAHPQGELFFPRPEAIHLVPRLALLSMLAVLGWRLWNLNGLFSWLILANLLTISLSSLLAGDPDGWSFTLGGPLERMDGLYYHFLLSGIALAAYTVFRGVSQSYTSLIKLFLATATIQAILIFFQRLGLDPVGIYTYGRESNLAIGSMGHYAIAGGLLLTALLVAIPLYLNTPSTRERYILLFAVGLTATALGFTGAKAAIYALLGVLVLSNLLRFSFRGLGIHLLIVVCLLLLPRLFPNPINFDRSFTDTSTFNNRIEIWQLSLMALRSIPGGPWIGGGPDALLIFLLRDLPPERLIPFLRLEKGWPANARIDSVERVSVGQKLRDRQLNLHFDQFGSEGPVLKNETIQPDKAHNFILDRWLAYGLLNVLIWMTLYLYPIWKGLASGNSMHNGIALALLGIFIYYLAWFPVVQLEPIHVIFLALSWAQFHRSP
jgi:O-antigen ligase